MKSENKDEDSTKRDPSTWERSLPLIIPINESSSTSVQHAWKKQKISSVQKAPKESPKKASQKIVAPKNVLKKVVAPKKAPKNHVAPIIAVGMGFDKDTGWIQVRQDLVEEIDTWRHNLYDKMWHDNGASKLRTIIDWHEGWRIFTSQSSIREATDVYFTLYSQGSTDDELSPTCVSSLLGIQIGVAAGLWHTVCLSAEGDVYAFGGNQFGQLGTGTDQAETLPRVLEAASMEDKHAKIVSCGARHTAVVTGTPNLCITGRFQYVEMRL
ncbi:hypothetical protein IFM89_032826 [Coptis chinensis]|uniref:Uncharacterized protein n=1 Tax=Coptis chinensis TaxID=261450 RepID=A0A835HQX2_9MAGN|nr:hypothetical protein IFM89_032826 [Coptis chinensis]